MNTLSKLSSEIVGNIEPANFDQHTLDIRALAAQKLDLAGGTLTGTLNQVAGLYNTGPFVQACDFLDDFIVTGLTATVPTPASLTLTLSPGSAYANHQRVHKAVGNPDLTYSYPIQSDTYVDLGQDGVVRYTAVGSGQTEPAKPANSIRLLKVSTGQTAITAITPYAQKIVNLLSNGPLLNNGSAVWTAATDGAGSGLDTDLIRGNNPDTVWATFRAGFTLSGGGDMKWLNNVFSWDTRFVIISTGNGAHFAAQGFFSIVQPPAGQNIMGYGGAPSRAATSSGVNLAAGEALYYTLPINGNSPSQPGNFAVVFYSRPFVIPSNWVLIAQANVDANTLRVGNGVTLGAGQNWTYQSGVAQTNGDTTQAFSVANATHNWQAINLGQADGRYLRSASASFTGRNTVNTTDDGISDWQVGGRGRYSGKLWLNSANANDHLLIERQSGTANLGVEFRLKNSNATELPIGLDGTGLFYINSNAVTVNQANNHVMLNALDDNTNPVIVGGQMRTTVSTANSGANINYWFPIGTYNVTAQNGSIANLIKLVKSGKSTAAGSNETALVSVRVKQAVPMGGSPIIELNLIESSGFKPSDIAFVLTGNTSNLTTGTLYVRNNQAGEEIGYTVLDTVTLSATFQLATAGAAGLAALPNSPTTNPSASLIKSNGHVLVKKESDDGSDFQVGGSASFVGNVSVPTANQGDNTTKAASTAYVQNAIASQAAKVDSPTFTGIPKAPNPTGTDASQQIATTYFVANNYLANTGNLAGLASPTQARSNLGLGSAAVQNVTAFAQAANNLSDLANIPNARSNLGLGSMATQNSNSVSITGGSISGLSALGFNLALLGGATDNGTGEVLQANGTIGSNSGGTTSISAIFGGDDSNTPGRTTGTTKRMKLALPHYTNPNKMAVLHGYSTAAQNILELGGGSSSMYAATQLNFYTAANATTVTGTLALTIDPTGRIRVRGMSDDTVSLFQVPGGINVQNIKFGSNANLSYVYTFSTSVTFTQIAANSWQKQDITVTGAQPGDAVQIGLPGAFTGGLMYQAVVTAANTVSLMAFNVTTAPITPPANTFRLTVMRWQ